ncbi:MAG: T9SS type A sorting domain-containing protein [Bacteroidota bacterium]|nr:T9SS type A sorting domain-containing protein [Bacteroidota bacterium]
MNKYLLAAVFLLLSVNVIASPTIPIIGLFTDFENFYPYPFTGHPEAVDTLNPWIIDKSNPDNIWQIGPSYKAEFGQAYSLPNAMITDTINSYPINNHSTFQFMVVKPEHFEYPQNCISYIHIGFSYKFQTDTLRDGGYIDISYDLGESWRNVINDEIAFFSPGSNFYGSSDTLINDMRGFSGEQGSWTYTSFILMIEDNELAEEQDSIIIRFNFVSDSIDNNKAGWIIDDISILVENRCGVGIEEFNDVNPTMIYPNPLSDVSLLRLPDDNYEYLIQIFNIHGIEVFRCRSKESVELSQSDFEPGAYIYKISNPLFASYTGKFIVH